MSEPSPSVPPRTASPPASPGVVARVIGWSTLSHEIAAATSFEQLATLEREALREAIFTARLGDRLLDPFDGSARDPDLSLELFREAAYFLRRGGIGLEPSSDPKVRAALEEPFQRSARRSRRERLATAEAVQRWLHPELEQKLGKFFPRPRLVVLRWLRVVPLLFAAVVLVGGLVLALVRAVRGPDLAAGRPWRTSSAQHTCDPKAGFCGGVRTDIFFHTKEEESPWIEIDLGQTVPVGRVEIENRKDAGADRAVPLVVEVSADGNTYARVADRSKAFTEWTATFDPVLARFVRLRAPRRTILHLETVAIRR